MSSKKNILIVSGPTASGKSQLGVALALRLAGEVINLDSVQMYSELTIGANKITESEMQAVPHHLLDVVMPDTQINANLFLELAHDKINQVVNRGKLAILVGGSTMYLTALLHGLAELPVADPELRQKFSSLSNSDIKEQLALVDKEASERIHINDRIRLERALEIQLRGDVNQTKALATHAHSTQLYNAQILLPTWERAFLRERIFERTHKMLELGLMQETLALIERYGRTAPALASIGYRECLQVIEGALVESELLNAIATHTYQYAKRQMLFFRNEPNKRGWIAEPLADGAQVITIKPTHKGETEQRVFNFSMQELLDSLDKDIGREGITVKWISGGGVFA